MIAIFTESVLAQVIMEIVLVRLVGIWMALVLIFN